jgi:predicted metalloprotease with PDZ domain
VRSAWLDAQRGFFNPTSLCLRVHGLDDAPHALSLQSTPATAKWRVFTGLDAAPNGAKANKSANKSAETLGAPMGGRFLARSYEHLADSPFEMGLPQDQGGTLWVGEFVARGTPHQFVVAGAWPGFNGARLLADTQKICETCIDFWHGRWADGESPAKLASARKGSAPMQRYVFSLNAVADGYGGLEHNNSTALIAKRADLPTHAADGLGLPALPNADGYTRLLGLISHEYFHTWNVKRLRPAEYQRYNFNGEQYTELLWFFEGFTSYYDDILLVRSGLLGPSAYLGLLEKTVQTVHAQPGRFVQSVAQASFDAWVKYYRQDANSVNQTISYYTKGSLVALCLDLTLRQEGRTSLDAVMRGVYKRTAGGPMSEAVLLQTLADLAGRGFEREINAWVHGTQDLPIAPLLAQHGVQLQTQRQETASGMAQSLGLVVSEGNVVQVRSVLNGGLAEQAGFAPQDEWWAVELPATAAQQKAGPSIWRMGSLQMLRQLAKPGQAVVAWVSRDQRVLQLRVQLPEANAEAKVFRLQLSDLPQVLRWLQPRV